MFLDKIMASGSYQEALHGRKSHYVMPPRGILIMLIHYLRCIIPYIILLCFSGDILFVQQTGLPQLCEIYLRKKQRCRNNGFFSLLCVVYRLRRKTVIVPDTILTKWRTPPRTVIPKHTNPNQRSCAGNGENKNCLPLRNDTRYTLYKVNKSVSKHPSVIRKGNFMAVL